MHWPMSQDYNEAVQTPAVSFADPDLRAGRAATNALGIPLPCSGNFADVYQLRCPGGDFAVKCFTREVSGLRERYSEIGIHLRRVRLPFAVDFEFLEQGVRVAGRWYPVLKMSWVEGLTLNAFVRDSVGKPETLEALARIWLRMAGRLRGAGIAHGDLQHGNVLLVPDRTGESLGVKLIDYDGMWVPALAGRPSGEIGHPAYQHPQRLREGTYGPEIDRFPLLVIYCALRCLQVGGRGLWERYDNGDNLLFRQQDFETPGRSPLFAELLRVSGLRDLVATLIDAARMPLDQTPLLMEEGEEGPGPEATGRPKGPAMKVPAEMADSSFAPPATVPLGERKLSTGRGALVGALITTAMFVLGCVGVGTLILMSAGGKRATSTLVSKPYTKPGSKPTAAPDVRPPKPDTESDSKPVVPEPIPMTVYRSQTVGGNGGKPFEETGGQGAFLIGFDVKLRGTEIAFLHPIYWTPAGRAMAVSGIGWPKDAQARPIVEAKDGYAIGGIMVWANRVGGLQLVRGIRILFLRRRGQVLNQEDSYWSEWIGSSGRGQEVMLGGDGKPIIGIHGRAGGAIDSLGVIQLR
jgi:hypothetical protein